MHDAGRVRLLWMSDAPTLRTGFGTVTREVLARLAGAFDLAAVGWGYDGCPYDRSEVPYDLYPSDVRSFGRDILPRAFSEFRPDILVCLGDLWMLEAITELPESRPHVVVYFPIDGEPFPPAWRRVLDAADTLLTCSAFGQRVTAEANPDRNVELIYHGVDTRVFRPLDKQAHKRRHRLDGRFVVGCVARNQPRKQLPVLVKAFARFAESRPDAFLYLHTDPDDVGWDLRDLLRRYGIDGRTAFSRAAAVGRGLPPAELNEVYNLFDVMALPTAGEGFGLPILESMAAGVPVIATDCSAVVELIEGRGERIAVKEWMTIGRFNIEQALADGDDLVSRLTLLYEDAALRERHAAAGLAFAQQFDWETIMERWRVVLDRAVAPRSVMAGGER